MRLFIPLLLSLLFSGCATTFKIDKNNYSTIQNHYTESEKGYFGFFFDSFNEKKLIASGRANIASWDVPAGDQKVTIRIIRATTTSTFSEETSDTYVSFSPTFNHNNKYRVNADVNGNSAEVWIEDLNGQKITSNQKAILKSYVLENCQYSCTKKYLN